MVQDLEIKTSIQHALVESSSIVDLVRLQEISQKLPQFETLQNQVKRLQQQLTDYFKTQEKRLSVNHFATEIVQQIEQLQFISSEIEDEQLRQRMRISLNNIRVSIGHMPAEEMFSTINAVGVSHG